MNKVINFSILYTSLLVVEFLGSFLILFITSSNYKGNFDATVLWNFWRVLFYGLPFLILYFLLFRYIRNKKLYKPLLFSLFNLLVYTLLSLLSRVIWGKNVPLPPEGIMFWITCMSIFLSPFVLYQVAYFNRLMKSL